MYPFTIWNTIRYRPSTTLKHEPTTNTEHSTTRDNYMHRPAASLEHSTTRNICMHRPAAGIKPPTRANGQWSQTWTYFWNSCKYTNGWFVNASSNDSLCVLSNYKQSFSFFFVLLGANYWLNSDKTVILVCTGHKGITFNSSRTRIEWPIWYNKFRFCHITVNNFILK